MEEVGGENELAAVSRDQRCVTCVVVTGEGVRVGCEAVVRGVEVRVGCEGVREGGGGEVAVRAAREEEGGSPQLPSLESCDGDGRRGLEGRGGEKVRSEAPV